MLGLKFQDDTADFDTKLAAFITALGTTAGGDSSIRERRTCRKIPRRRRPDRDHRRADLRAGLYESRSPKIEARRDRTSSERAAAAAVKRLELYLAGLATALGFEAADRA